MVAMYADKKNNSTHGNQDATTQDTNGCATVATNEKPSRHRPQHHQTSMSRKNAPSPSMDWLHWIGTIVVATSAEPTNQYVAEKCSTTLHGLELLFMHRSALKADS